MELGLAFVCLVGMGPDLRQGDESILGRRVVRRWLLRVDIGCRVGFSFGVFDWHGP
ncbi:hypothetical protein PCIT_b0412 [Pseudoalteromonas citrea]|uniref:Uncharacterized protein n=2 Tax=Pseudoalteromonas citrea TaxID=43655 RepID=A0AAD4FPV0_9GAMM|nr:hypothetical protein PCIT_b0412 [Pseudoalteromonas citrea]